MSNIRIFTFFLLITVVSVPSVYVVNAQSLLDLSPILSPIIGGESTTTSSPSLDTSTTPTITDTTPTPSPDAGSGSTDTTTTPNPGITTPSDTTPTTTPTPDTNTGGNINDAIQNLLPIINGQNTSGGVAEIKTTPTLPAKIDNLPATLDSHWQQTVSVDANGNFSTPVEINNQSVFVHVSSSWVEKQFSLKSSNDGNFQYVIDSFSGDNNAVVATMVDSSSTTSWKGLYAVTSDKVLIR